MSDDGQRARLARIRRALRRFTQVEPGGQGQLFVDEELVEEQLEEERSRPFCYGCGSFHAAGEGPEGCRAGRDA